MPSADAEAAILRRVAATALDDCRTAWRTARDSPTVEHVRAAFRACIFAARALRRAASVLPSEAPQLFDAADKVDDAAAELKSKLVRMPE